MYDLAAFRQRIQDLYRRSSPYEGRRPSQQDLADAVGLNRSELSSRLNGLKQAKLTNRDVQAILKTLAEWEAISTQAEAVELLALVDCPNFTPAEWQSPPLSELEPSTQSVEKPRSNLPRSLTAFVGRKQEMADAGDLLREHRLITIVGVGGSGKTRLTLEVAQQAERRFADGVFLVELANLRDTNTLPAAVASSLGVATQVNQPLTLTLRRFLRTKHLLLVLDNCEHLTAAVADLVSELLSACPRLSVLASSRASLAVAGETVYPLHPLSLPKGAGLKELGKADAVQLLLDRVHSFRPTFQITADNAIAIQAICTQLDGLPLAIELAAARLQMLSPAQLAASLSERFRFLTDRRHGIAPRHQTLRALIDWSYDLLPPAPQGLLYQLAVFRGGFTLEAAAGTLAASPLDLIDTLTELLNKSLIQNALVSDAATLSDDPDAEQPRFAMLETIREYALLRLRENGAEQQAQQAHAAWYRQLASTAGEELRSGNQARWRVLLEQEYYNLQAAIDWSLRDEQPPTTALDIAAALWRFWPASGRVAEARRWLAAALDRATAAAPQLRAQALESAGRLAHLQADEEQASRYFHAALELYRQLDDQRGIASSYNNLGSAALRMDDYPRAREYYEASLVLRRQLGDQLEVSICLGNLGMIAESLGDYAAARPLYVQSLAIRRALGNKAAVASQLVNLADLLIAIGEYRNARASYREALDTYRELNDEWNIPIALTALANAAVRLGDYAEADQLYRQSITLLRELENWLEVGLTLVGIARLAGAKGQLRHAATLLGAASAMMEKVNIEFSGLQATEYAQCRATVIAALGEAEFAAAFTEGQQFDVPTAITYALS